MPIKLSLVFVKRNQHHDENSYSYPQHTSYQPPQRISLKISLRRVLGAPNTGCKSCRG